MSVAVLSRETLSYGARPVLQEVSLSLASGDRIVLLGRSGAGKTTLLNALYDRLGTTGKRVALVPQDHALVPQLSVTRNVLMGRLDDHGPLYNLASLVRPRRDDHAAIRKVLDTVGLSEMGDRQVESLSGGQMQRTALARAFFRGGDVLIADEPVSAVDEAQGASLLQEVSARFSTFVLALHDVVQARATATRLVGIREGRLEFDAAPDVLDDDRIAALYA